MEIMSNGSDRSFELLNWRYDAASTVHPYLYKYPSVTLSLYIYIYREREMGYCTSRCTDCPVHRARFYKSKVQIFDPNRSS